MATRTDDRESNRASETANTPHRRAHTTGDLAVEDVKASSARRKLKALIQTLHPERPFPDRLVVRSDGRVYFFRADEIVWVEADRNRVRMHANGREYPLRGTMKGLEAKLDPAQFIRIHRSAIVNVDQIRELGPWIHGEYIVVLRDDTRLRASREFAHRLRVLID